MTRVSSIVAMIGLMAEGFRRPAACQSFNSTSPTPWVGRSWLVTAMMIKNRAGSGGKPRSVSSFKMRKWMLPLGTEC